MIISLKQYLGRWFFYLSNNLAYQNFYLLQFVLIKFDLFLKIKHLLIKYKEDHKTFLLFNKNNSNQYLVNWSIVNWDLN